MTGKCFFMYVLAFYPCVVFSSKFHVMGRIEYCHPSESKMIEIEESYKNYPKIWTAVKLLMPQNNPEVKIEAKGIGPFVGKNHFFLLNNKNQVILPNGMYKLECLTHDIYWGELYCENLFVKKDQILRVPCGWFSVNEHKRFLCVYCFEKGSFVNVSGRIIDDNGNGIGNIKVSCSLDVDGDRIFWDKIDVKTDKNGGFFIPNLPPASIDRVVYCLLYGNSKYGRSLGLGLLQAKLEIGAGNVSNRIYLVSEKNLLKIRPLAARIRSYGPMGGAKGYQYVDEQIALKKFPVSTNNVIYVGDIVLPDKKQQGKN